MDCFLFNIFSLSCVGLRFCMTVSMSLDLISIVAKSRNEVLWFHYNFSVLCMNFLVNRCISFLNFFCGLI